jgi:D-2-hydroxyacid dehydrogenase (NADP+)
MTKTQKQEFDMFERSAMQHLNGVPQSMPKSCDRELILHAISRENKLRVLISFGLPSAYVKKIRTVSPNLEVLQSEDQKELLQLVRDADILFAGFFSKDLFLAARKLKWIQTWGAGVERFLLPEVVKSNVILTNAGGVHPTPVSEHVVMLMLCFCHKLHLFIRKQMERKWEEYESWISTEQIEELSGKTIGIVGLGRIGAEIAQKAKCLGMRVIATKRDLSRAASTHVDRLIHPNYLNELLAESDFVVLSLPLTKETQGMIGEAQLKSMKRTGCVINISRGKIVQEDKLIEALKHGWIAGAGLDTFEKEPLPNNSALWNFKNVIITPHTAGLTPYYLERLTDIFCENLNRFMNKQTLMNIVNKALGY